MQLDEFHRLTSRDLAKALSTTLLTTQNSDFPDLVQQYKLVETEFVTLSGDNEFHALETRRRVAEAILEVAIDKEQSFDTCTKLWNELVCLGFTNIGQAAFMSWYYASCCRENNEIEAGLRVIEPVVARLEERLATRDLTENEVEFYREHIEMLQKLRAKLECALEHG